MELSGTMLLFSNFIADFCVCQNFSTDVLVVHLELGMHEHDQTHLINIMFTSFLQDLDIIEGAPVSGGKIEFQWSRTHHTIYVVQGRVIGAAFMVCVVRNTRQNSSVIFLFSPSCTVGGWRRDAINEALVFKRLWLDH